MKRNAPRGPKPGSVGRALSEPMPNPPGSTSFWIERAQAGFTQIVRRAEVSGHDLHAMPR